MGGETVLVGVDGGDSGRAALRAAAAYAARDRVRLRAVHVRPGPLPGEWLGWPSMELYDTAWRDALELDAWLCCTLLLGGQGLDWEFVATEGRPADALRERVRLDAACAVYVGARVRSRWAARLHRCTAVDLARRCACPVRVIRFAGPGSVTP
ncbi:universal stress protein [Actinoallomurus spadix]|uniref:UspA domain-containing protein n=1 Tax=Actinoallomurus spadix TaxID=79912 RepID=A0ABN0XCS7_9ACTN|nr:universal stress protein [Actinoallomurus spadix]MCO5988675.1 universal stress protein [Actinoallomurus spadix]